MRPRLLHLLHQLMNVSAGHHEIPLSAPTKILDTFPPTLPRGKENVIEAGADKTRFSEVRTSVARQTLLVP